MAGEKINHTEEAAEAARCALIEVMRILGEYRDDMVLVGGWIPELLAGSATEKHVGSMDVDLALNHQELAKAGYRRMSEILREHGYDPDARQPFTFRKRIRRQVVQVDFLAGEYGGTGRTHRTQSAADIRPRKARGCDLVFQIPPETVTLCGQLPDGARDEVHVKIASVVPFLVMKGMALADRRKAKDAYDICFVLQHYQGGVEAVIKAFEMYKTLPLVIEGMRKMAGKFASLEHTGPRDAATFDDRLDAEERELRQRDAFEKVQYLVKSLGVETA